MRHFEVVDVSEAITDQHLRGVVHCQLVFLSELAYEEEYIGRHTQCRDVFWPDFHGTLSSSEVASSLAYRHKTLSPAWTALHTREYYTP